MREESNDDTRHTKICMGVDGVTEVLDTQSDVLYIASTSKSTIPFARSGSLAKQLIITGQS